MYVSFFEMNGASTRCAATFANGAACLISASPPTWSGWVCVMKIVVRSDGFTLIRPR
ncbi:MAG TPA: hypothetical protein VIL45_01055 [Thermoplasmata archaeon]